MKIGSSFISKIITFVFVSTVVTSMHAKEKPIESLSLTELKAKVTDYYNGNPSIDTKTAYKIAEKLYEREPTEENANHIIILYDMLPLEDLPALTTQQTQYFESFYKKYPTNDNLLTSYCWHSLEHKQKLKAKKICTESYNSFTEDYMNNMSLGHILFMQGNKEEARIYFESALVAIDSYSLKQMMNYFDTFDYIYSKEQAKNLKAFMKSKHNKYYKDNYQVYEKLLNAELNGKNAVAVKLNNTLLKSIANGLGKKSIIYGSFLEKQAILYTPLDDEGEIVIKLREEVADIYKNVRINGEKLDNDSVKENLMILDMIKALS